MTEIVPSLAGQAANVHFDDHFDNGVLVFDYTLKPGIVQSSNAIALMRAVGLKCKPCRLSVVSCQFKGR